MRFLRYLALLTILLLPAAAYSHAQVSVGVGVGGPVYGGYGYGYPAPSALMATMATILMPARPMDTMARRGLPAASLSVPDPGTTVMDTATAACMAIAAATMDTLVMGTAIPVMLVAQYRIAAAIAAPAPLEADLPAAASTAT